MSKPNGILFIFAAASGTGKTTLVNALLKTLADIKISISHTTRPKRPAEVDGQHYHFVNDKTFENLIAENAFLEYADVHGHYYGTSKSWIEQELQIGCDVILEIDWQGAQKVREHVPCASVFILPPSMAMLEKRLTSRNQDNRDVITKRLEAASEEISHCNEFDYLLVNNEFDQALAELKIIVLAERLSQPRQAQALALLLAELVKK